MSTKCITFYSYKGGSGRSTTAINTVRALAEKMGVSAKRPILLIDADIESAGLTYYFGQENNFCDAYTQSGTFHTTHVLNVLSPSELPFDRSRPEPQMSAPLDFLRLFSGDDCFGQTRLSSDKPVSAQELFQGVQLSKKEWDILRGIIEKYATRKQSRASSALRHNPAPLVESLKRIHESGELKMAEAKAESIRKFLPARVFSDVSEHFGCERGSIRFLGVDVNYEKAQIAKNSTATMQINNLIEECSKRDYAAIVFDSGAGTQSTAHACHQCSDVIVYCMRPSSQFIAGTRNNISEYKSILQASQWEKKSPDNSEKGDDCAKNIIILPTAVPRNTQLISLSNDCFAGIGRIALKNKDFVDGYFCSADKALCEVELFKFKEHILGVALPESADVSAEVKSIIDRYSDPSSPAFPEDARAAYDTYNMLAERIMKNCEV